MVINLSDTFNLLSKVSIPRAANYLKLFATYHVSKLEGRSLHKGYPFSVSIEPTTSCNLRCPECPSGLRSFSRNTGMLKMDLFRNIIDQLHQNLLYLTLYFQGEPFLNPDFHNFIRYASEKNIYTATSTNGHYLTPENSVKTIEAGLDRLIISIDGTTQETYSKYRIGGNLEKVLQGVTNLTSAKKSLRSKTPYVLIQFIANKYNEHQIGEIKKLSRKAGANSCAIKTMQVYTDKSNWEPENKNLSRYNNLTNENMNHCWRMWQGCVITWDGKIVPCCFDKDASHSLGNLEEKSFIHIWKSPAYHNFRNSVLRSRKEIDICTNCTEGAKVWA